MIYMDGFKSLPSACTARFHNFPKQSLAFLSLLFLTILKIFLAPSLSSVANTSAPEWRWGWLVTTESSNPKTKVRRLGQAELVFASDSNFFPTCVVLSPTVHSLTVRRKKVWQGHTRPCPAGVGHDWGMFQTMTPDPVLRYAAVSRVHCLNQWHVSRPGEYDSSREGQTSNH